MGQYNYNVDAVFIYQVCLFICSNGGQGGSGKSHIDIK